MARMSRRLMYAERVCREARYQMAKAGGIYDNKRLASFLIPWIGRSGKDKYERPKPKGGEHDR
jgi:hypothetical protein